MKSKTFVWLLLLPVVSYFQKSFSQSSTTNLSFTLIPSSTEVPGPGRGASEWHSSDPNNIVNTVSETVMGKVYDTYGRSFFTWDRMESSQGVYNWSYFDAQMNDAITNGRKFNFSIMALAPGYNQGPVVSGVGMAYPLYLHDLMQAEGGNSQDFISVKNGLR